MFSKGGNRFISIDVWLSGEYYHLSDNTKNCCWKITRSPLIFIFKFQNINTILLEKFRISFFILVSLNVFSVILQTQFIYEWLPNNENSKIKIDKIYFNAW